MVPCSRGFSQSVTAPIIPLDNDDSMDVEIEDMTPSIGVVGAEQKKAPAPQNSVATLTETVDNTSPSDDDAALARALAEEEDRQFAASLQRYSSSRPNRSAAPINRICTFMCCRFLVGIILISNLVAVCLCPRRLRLPFSYQVPQKAHGK